MKSTKNVRKLPHLITSLLTGFALSTPAWAGNTITDLGADYVSLDINNSGQVLVASKYNLYSSYLYSNGTMHNLPLVDGFVLNNQGQVLGNTHNYNPPTAVYNNGITTYISNMMGTAINDNGQVVGKSTSGQTVIYSNGAINNVGAIPSNYYSNSINNQGQLAGNFNNGDGYSHAFSYSNGTVQDIGTLKNGSASYAAAINNSGQVVGYAGTTAYLISPFVNHAFLYSNGSMIDLGTVDPGQWSDSAATDINNQGQVVGTLSYNCHCDDFRTPNAFLYSNGKMMDLNVLRDADSGWVLTSASAINDLGQIVGQGVFNGQVHAYMMTVNNPSPVPLPTSVWLFGSGLIGLVGTAKRKIK